MALIVAVQAGAQCLNGRCLALAVDGGDDANAIGKNILLHQFRSLQADHFAHIGGVHLGLGGMEAGAYRFGLSYLASLRSKNTGFFHAKQDPVAPHPRPFRVGDRVIG